MKKLAVDVEASLRYKANGRVKAASKKELAHLFKKKFECPKCLEISETDPISFGEMITCKKCGTIMVEVMNG
jgi:transcription elongation factor Elf1